MSWAIVLNTLQILGIGLVEPLRVSKVAEPFRLSSRGSNDEGMGATVGLAMVYMEKRKSIERIWRDILMAEDERFDYKTALFDLSREHGTALLGAAQQENLSQFKAVIEYSKIAINGAFLLNGMAGVAILYNIKLLDVRGYTALKYCALGAVCAVLCAGLSYVAQRVYARVSLDNNDLRLTYFFGVMSGFICKADVNKTPPELKKPILGHVISVIACIFWGVSVLLFLIAAYSTLSIL